MNPTARLKHRRAEVASPTASLSRLRADVASPTTEVKDPITELSNRTTDRNRPCAGGAPPVARLRRARSPTFATRTIAPAAAALSRQPALRERSPRGDNANVQAQQVCPGVCSAVEDSWNGQWTTTVFGVMSFCGCCEEHEIPKRSTDPSTDANHQ
ncbi:MAG: mannan-binding lectin [Rhodanobacteraceae bacterium]|nr:mannan-binding lectin [Rhodanobacteraceae bacterium]